MQELELIVKDSLDFDQALEVVLHRYGNKSPPSLGMTENISNREEEAESSHADANNYSDEEELWERPLSTCFFRNDSTGLESLKRFTSSAVSSFGDELDLVIDRKKDVLEQAARKYKNSSFDVTRPLNVSFKGESGLDAGGLTREYFQLLIDRMQKQTSASITLFEGCNDHLLPIHNYDLLSGGFFILAGKMILHSILNKYHGIMGLCPAVVVYLITGSRDAAIEHITLEDVPDPLYQKILAEVTSMVLASLVIITANINFLGNCFIIAHFLFSI